MGKQTVALQAFNRGIVSPLALARTDIKRTALSAETMTNWVPRVLGSMMLRPGLSYLGSSRSDAAAKFIPFVFSTNDVALVEVTDSNVRVWVDDALVTRPTVTSAVTNGLFTTDVLNWTDVDDAGATSVWVTGGYMGLTGDTTGTTFAKRRQQVSVTASVNIEHALNIVIERGPVILRVGSSAGGDQYISETSLETGTHSLAFTPTADFHIEFSSNLKRQVLVNSCSVASAGVMVITGPWLAADLDMIRYDQSGDIIFNACDGFQQRKIERRGLRSWSVVTYQPEDGPFGSVNIGPITITSSALYGNVTLTASAPLWTASHVGAMFRATSSGQSVTGSVTAANQFTNAILVEGVGSQRVFTIVISGTWVATVTLQRSLTSGAGPWEDVTTYTANTTVAYNDALDNQEAWYRIGVKTGNYTSGTVTLTLSYAVGSVDGIARITAFSSSTSVSAEVFKDFGGTAATDNWAEGEWSDVSGWPSAPVFSEGRLWWAGKNGVWGSVSDSFYSLDDTTVGDSAPIARTIGAGPVDVINWILALQRLLLGAEGAEFSCKSSSLDEPLTATNFNIKPASTQGSASVAAVRIDKRGVYVQRGGTRVMEISYNGEDGEFGSSDLTILAPEVCQPRVVRMAVQRQPDTRIHCVKSDGTVAILVFDRAENVSCWCEFETDGLVEDVVVLPGAEGDTEDKVYYHVNRTINGSTKRYLELWALESECVGSTLNKQADSFILYSGVSTTTITGLSHLEAKSVVVWGNGVSLGSYTVTSGQITGLTSAVTSAVIGVAYTAQWKSSKLAYAAGMGSALTQKKKLNHLGLILKDTHYQGLRYGTDFTNLDDLPGIESGTSVAANTIHSVYDEEAFEFPGEWDTDARLCLQAQAPKPCNILAAIIGVETNEKY